jgi:2-oxoglutarate ferredoxin oxidoreductase subunit beta
VAMLKWMKSHAMPIKAAKSLPPEKLEGKFLTGVLWDIEKPEFCEEYEKIIQRFQKEERD